MTNAVCYLDSAVSPASSSQIIVSGGSRDQVGAERSTDGGRGTDVRRGTLGPSRWCVRVVAEHSEGERWDGDCVRRRYVRPPFRSDVDVGLPRTCRSSRFTLFCSAQERLRGCRLDAGGVLLRVQASYRRQTSAGGGLSTREVPTLVLGDDRRVRGRLWRLRIESFEDLAKH